MTASLKPSMGWAIAFTTLMHRSQLFNQPRLQLTLWYTAVIGGILGLAGFTTYEMVAHSHWDAVDQELLTISGTLYDSLELKLKQAGRLEPTVQGILPNLCLPDRHCAMLSDEVKRQSLNAFQQTGYYIRFFDLQGTLLATAGEVPTGLAVQLDDRHLQTLTDSSGVRYQQYSLLLKNQQGGSWGYMQIGRSLKEFDDHLSFLRLTLLAGLPITMLLVAAASWGLAGVAIRPIYQSYRKMQQFTADAAHELRTPLATIRAIIESIRDVDLSEAEAKEALAGVDRQNQRLIQLAQDLLLLSRLEAPPETFTQPSAFTPCCVNELILDVVESLLVLEMAASIRLTCQILVEKPLFVVGDEGQLVRLISNLVTNALQYTPAGGKVTVTLSQEEQQALIQIQDTGIGISPEDQVQIFDRFYRVSRDRSRHTGGTGLGLAIAQAIVHLHQGTIQVESELQKGSIFKVYLPLASI